MSVVVPTVETMRLLLRAWHDDDLAPLARIVAEPEVTRYMFGDGAPLDETGAREALERRRTSWERDGVGFWAVELKETGQLIGWAGLQLATAHPELGRAVEVGWMLGHRWWGQGYAPEAGEASITYGFSELGLDRIYAFHAPENANSERVMVKLGMQPAGETVDVRDGSVSKLRVITREEWRLLLEERGRPNPHSDPVRLANVVGYDAGGVHALLSRVEAAEVHAALLDALARSWPGPALPGAPAAYAAGDEGAQQLGLRMSADRTAGRTPLLVVVDLAAAPDPETRLVELHAMTAREGVWLHAGLAVRHGVSIPALPRADSIGFDVPTPLGRRRIFATRHPRILDEEFLAALDVSPQDVRRGTFG